MRSLLIRRLRRRLSTLETTPCCFSFPVEKCSSEDSVGRRFQVRCFRRRLSSDFLLASHLFDGFLLNTDGLREYFSKYGDIKECVVMRDPVTKKSR